MKIAMHHQEHHAHGQPRLATGASRLSFSQLLEGGASAASISQGRALSFAEVGILGVHYAHDLGGQPTASGGASRSSKEQDKAEVQAFEQVSLTKHVPSDAAFDPVTGAKRLFVENRPHSSLVGQERPDSLSLAEVPVSLAAPVDTASDELLGFARAVAPHIRTDRKATPFRLTVFGEANAAAIVFENGSIDDGEAEELEALAQKIAAEFGVTVKRFVTRTSFGLHISGL